MKILITGPTSGTGKYLAQTLGRHHELVVLGRNPDRMAQLQEEIGQIHPYVVNLADYSDVVRVSALVADNHPDLDVFISNAGILGNEQPVKNAEGLEATFMTNFLSHYLLQGELVKVLLKNQGTIFNICSQSHDWFTLDFDDLQSTAKYQPMKAYGRSKRMLMLLGRKTSQAGIRSYNIDPGTFRSGIARSRGQWFQFLYNLAKFGMKSPADAVKDVIAILNGELSHLPSGEFIRKGKVVEIDYSEEEIGKLMEATKSITGLDLNAKLGI